MDIDAILITANSEKEEAAGNYKGGFGFHPLLCYLAETGEPLAGLLRPGNAGSNTAADHFCVLQTALEQLKARAREAIVDLPETAWRGAIDAEGKAREGAQVTELTEEVDLSTWPEGTRLIVRRERPHPGAQFEVFDADGYRHTAFITDQRGADIAALELRHRRRARVEDAIRTGKETGMRSLPFAAFAHNRVWLELSLIAQELLCFARSLCLTRRTTLRLPRGWPWADALATAFARLRALPAGAAP